MFRENVITELFSNKRNIVKLGIDLLSVVAGIFLGLLVRFENRFLENIHESYFLVYGVAFLAVYLFRKNGLKSWSYTNSLDVLNLAFTNLVALMITLSYYAVLRESYSRTVVLVGFVMILMLQLLWRFFFRLNRSYRVLLGKNKPKMNTLVYGAGDAGVALIRDGLTNPNYPYHITAILDDDRRKRGTYINGVKVFGDFYDLADVVREQSIEMVIIAIPTIKRERIKEIIDLTKCCSDVKVKILPGLDDILQDENIANQVRDVSIEDLLGREQVLVNGDNIKDIIEDKVVFVTGGAGSIGSELARQIARYKPKKLVTIDVNENDLYFLELELKRAFKDLDLQSEICNIREEDKVELLFNRYNPNIVFHAAAHKHVPLMEHNPEEAIKNNIFGTKKVAEMAIKYGVERFVLISTDKAVNPTNIMGATKRACEIVVESMNGKSDTKFMAVRFGNVLGSNGSVIPIFKKLISEGKNLTLTHPDITRYFMTIPEAAQLVIEAGSLGKGGELFILDMGEPVKIIDLARTMIKLSNADVDIEIVGLRPGEKLYEELLYDVSAALKTENNKIFITKIDPMDIQLDYHLEKLAAAIKAPEKENLKTLMKEFVITYKEAPLEVKKLMEKVILIGAGGHARVLVDAALHDENIEIVGFLDDGDIDEILGVKKLGNTSEIEKFRNYKFHIAIGNNSLREQLGAEIGSEKLVTIVHPTAYISRDVQIGRGCYIGANAVINSKAILEDMVIVNTKSVVEHDCILKGASHLSYGVLLGSSVKVDEKVYIEMGSVVQRGIKVERDIR